MEETSRFYDVATGRPPVSLELRQDGAGFRMLRQFGYRDPRHAEPFVVPADVEQFSTDLTSVPWVFAWLVPGLGTHLPAVLLHDALVLGRGEPKRHVGPDVDRVEADRILRDGMATLGTPVIRRWLMWAAVIVATCWSDLRPRWWWRLVEVVTFGTIVVLGVLATLDLFDAADVLPWMADRAWWAELLGGAAGAVVVPLVLSVLWQRLWAAAVIAGMALAFLLHVTLAVVAVYGIYWVAESVLSRSEGGADSRQNLERKVPSTGAG